MLPLTAVRSNPDRDFEFTSCQEAFRLAYRTSVVLLRCPLVSEIKHGGIHGIFLHSNATGTLTHINATGTLIVLVRLEPQQENENFSCLQF